MAIEQFQKFLDENQLPYKVIVTDEVTHTAQQAADTHSVPVCNIVKSLLTRGDETFFLILVPGDKRLDLEEWREKLSQTELRMANADEVKIVTGYSIGGVPPFGHNEKIVTYIANGFDSASLLCAAAGSANAVFKIPLVELQNQVS